MRNTDGPTPAPRVLPGVIVYDGSMSVEEAMLIWEILVRVLAQHEPVTQEDTP
jgi:hypothetical protein